ncbi:MAG: AMP-binding protein [Eubacteriales bacterium]|nr:AMP-binding protein [Eubacteriales bacterium]
MEQQIIQIAKRISELRRIVGKSPEEMASVTNTSVEYYLDSESGKNDFSFTFIYSCARALGVDITELITGDNAKLSTYSIVRRGEGVPLERRKGFNYNHLAANFKGRSSEPFFVTAKYDPEAEGKAIPLAIHEGEEFDYVVSGVLKIEVAGHIDTLYPGDSIYYNSSEPHGMIAVEGHDCEFLAMITDIRGHAAEYHGLIESKTIEKKQIKKYGDFVESTENENGELISISFPNKERFNFAYDALDIIAAETPDKQALLYIDCDKNERSFSFSDISRLSAKAANYFEESGVRSGDRVLVLVKRHWQFWIIAMALCRIGAILIPATNMLLKKDLIYRFKTGGITTVIATSDGDTAEQVELAAEEYQGIKHKFTVKQKRSGWDFFDDEYEKFSSSYPRKEDTPCGEDNMLMYFSSGTTGEPKLVMHSHTYPLGHFVTARYWHDIREGDLHFTISDTGWGKALWGKLYSQWMAGGSVFTYDFDRFDASDILPMFSKYNITTFCAPPTMFRMFIKEDLSLYDLSSIRYATTAGEALNPEVFNKLNAATGIKLMEGFGQTETTLTIANLKGSEIRLGSTGKPNPMYNIVILDSEGKPAETGETGEICVYTGDEKPCGLFLGYYSDSEQDNIDTAQTESVWYDNYYHTGDMAWADEDGYMWYVGRSDDLIKSSGYRIGPFEIESVIMELPYVLECAVTGVPDELRGQLVKATIVPIKGVEVSESLKKEIQDYVKTHTAPYKYPRIVEFVDSLPKTFNGKIKRGAIRSQESRKK